MVQGGVVVDRSRRARILRHLILGAWVVLGMALARLQIVEGPAYRVRSEQNRVRWLTSEAPRGEVCDRYGLVLAGTRLSFDLTVLPQDVRSIEATMARLGPLLGEEPSRLLRRYRAGYIAPFVPVVVAPDVPRDIAFLVEEEGVPGVVVTPVPRRWYPRGAVAAHLIGYVGRIDQRELARLERYGYTQRDLIGKAGVEATFDHYLRGTRGRTMVEVDARGRVTRTLATGPATAGKPLTLTVDLRIQTAAHRLLEGRAGAIIVLDPRDGAVLALASAPEYDLNAFVTPARQGEVAALLDHPEHPLLDRAIGAAFPPGSLFKIVTATAALETAPQWAHRSLECQGTLRIGNRVFACWNRDGHGVQGLVDALTHSCNVFFYRAGGEVGAERLVAYGRRFGLGAPTGIELPHERGGHLPDAGDAPRRTGGDLANLAIGQGDLLVTPLQVARMAAVVANGGRLVRPFLAARVEALDVHGRAGQATGVSGETLEQLQQGMERVVSDPTGTGRFGAVAGLRLCAKTGTAQVRQQRSHAWFMGFGPREAPAVAFAVFLEHGGSGSDTAALMARDLLASLQEQGMIGSGSSQLAFHPPGGAP